MIKISFCWFIVVSHLQNSKVDDHSTIKNFIESLGDSVNITPNANNESSSAASAAVKQVSSYSQKSDHTADMETVIDIELPSVKYKKKKALQLVETIPPLQNQTRKQADSNQLDKDLALSDSDDPNSKEEDAKKLSP